MKLFIKEVRNLIQVNYGAVLICAIAAMITGYLWYGKMLFGKTWMQLTGVTEADAKKGNMVLMYGGMFAGALIEAFVLSHFIHYAGAYSLVNGIKTGVWAWLGFVAPVMFGNYMFAGKPKKLFYIDGGYALINLMIMGAILATWF